MCGGRAGFNGDRAWEIENENGNIKIIKIFLHRAFLWRSISDITKKVLRLDSEKNINSSISCQPYVT